MTAAPTLSSNTAPGQPGSLGPTQWRRSDDEPFGGGDQAVIQTPGIPGGLHDGVTTATFTAYFKVDDISQAVTQVRELGGHAEDPSPYEPGFGRFSTCTDDQGIPFGLHQPQDE